MFPYGQHEIGVQNPSLKKLLFSSDSIKERQYIIEWKSFDTELNSQDAAIINHSTVIY